MARRTFVLASANVDKAAEIAAILADVPDLTLLPRPADVPDVEETGDTLEDNARLKARALCEATGRSAVADDTGLEVEALDGAPGVYSARFAGEGAAYADNVAKLVTELERVGATRPDQRRARFRSVAFVAHPDGTELWVEGEVTGVITPEPGGPRIRLRPAVRAGRLRRADLRPDDARREARRLPPRPGVPGPGRTPDGGGMTPPRVRAAAEAARRAMVDLAAGNDRFRAVLARAGGELTALSERATAQAEARRAGVPDAYGGSYFGEGRDALGDREGRSGYAALRPHRLQCRHRRMAAVAELPGDARHSTSAAPPGIWSRYSVSGGSTPRAVTSAASPWTTPHRERSDTYGWPTSSPGCPGRTGRSSW